MQHAAIGVFTQAVSFGGWSASNQRIEVWLWWLREKSTPAWSRGGREGSPGPFLSSISVPIYFITSLFAYKFLQFPQGSSCSLMAGGTTHLESVPGGPASLLQC